MVQNKKQTNVLNKSYTIYLILIINVSFSRLSFNAISIDCEFQKWYQFITYFKSYYFLLLILGHSNTSAIFTCSTEVQRKRAIKSSGNNKIDNDLDDDGAKLSSDNVDD